MRPCGTVMSIRAIEDDRAADLMTVSKNGQDLRIKVDRDRHGSFRNAVFVPYEVPMLHGMADIEQRSGTGREKLPLPSVKIGAPQIDSVGGLMCHRESCAR